MDEIERILKDLEETRRRRYFYWEKLIVIDVFRIFTDYSDYPLTPLAWRPSGEVTYLYGDDATSLIFGDMYRALRKEGIPLEVEVALEGKKVKRIKSMRPLDAISIDAFLRRLRELVEKKVPKGSYYWGYFEVTPISTPYPGLAMKLRGSREAFYAPIEVSAQYERLWEYVLDGGSEVFAFVVRNTFPLPTEIGGLLWFSEDQLKSLRKAQLEGLMNAVREVKEVVKKQEVEIEKLKSELERLREKLEGRR